VCDQRIKLTLARLEAAQGFVDHIDASLTAHEAVVAMTRTKGLKRVSYFHCNAPVEGKAGGWWALEGSNL
jgi:hypothetical protein